MPIGNVFLSKYTMLKAWSPMVNDEEEDIMLQSCNLVYSSFKKSIISSTSPKTLIQGHPLASVFETSAVKYSYEISIPILLKINEDDKDSMSIRSNEIEFWNNWMKYAINSLDKLHVKNSLPSIVVTKASITISVNSDISLSLTIETNTDLDWHRFISNEINVSRSARSYDAKIKHYHYEDGLVLPSTTKPIVGWEDIYLINNFNFSINTDTESLLTTKNYKNHKHHIVDTINAVLVKYSGSIDVVGPPMSSMPLSLQEINKMNTGGYIDNIFTDEMKNGGVRVTLGDYCLSVLPNDILIHEGTTDSSGELISEQRSFHGILATNFNH